MFGLSDLLNSKAGQLTIDQNYRNISRIVIYFKFCNINGLYCNRISSLLVAYDRNNKMFNYCDFNEASLFCSCGETNRMKSDFLKFFT